MTALGDAILADSPDRLWTLCETELVLGNYRYPESIVDLQNLRRFADGFVAEDDPGDLTSPCNAGDCPATHLAGGDFLDPDGTDATFDWGGGGTYDWTLEVWFQVLATEAGGSVQIGGDDEPAFTADWYIRVTDAGAVEVGGYSTGVGDFITLTGSVTADPCWHQLVWQSQGSAEGDDVTLYLDGAMVDTQSGPYDDWYAGTIPGNSFFWGTLGQYDSDVALSHLAMWQSILTPSEIEAHWDAAGPCPCGAGGWYLGKLVSGSGSALL